MSGQPVRRRCLPRRAWPRIMRHERMKLPRRISKQSVFVALMIAAAACSLLGRRVADPMRGFVQFALVPLSDPMMYLTDAVKTRLDEAGARSFSPAEGAELLRQNELFQFHYVRLLEELRQAQDRVAAVQKLHHRLAGPSDDFPCELIEARVVSAAALPYENSRVVNAGTSDGVSDGSRVLSRLLKTDRTKSLPPNLAVIVNESLVGRVSRSGQYAAVLELVTDRKFEIGGRIWRNPQKERQILVGSAWQKLTPQNARLDTALAARGDGVGELVIEQVPVNHKIMPGDWFVTREDQAFLPANVLIGTVSQVKDDLKHPGMTTLRIRPAADVDAVRDVYIVLPLKEPPEPVTRGGGRR